MTVKIKEDSFSKAWDHNAELFGTIRFTLKPEHIALLRSTYTSWWDAEFGAPGIDPKHDVERRCKAKFKSEP